MEIFEIYIFLVLNFFLVGPSFNHTSANFENKKKGIFWMSPKLAKLQERTIFFQTL